MSNINISEATIALIDSLKSTTGAYGLAGTGSEYKIVTEMFLYKFFNDKFGYEAKRNEVYGERLRNAEKWDAEYDKFTEDEVVKLKRTLFTCLILASTSSFVTITSLAILFCPEPVPSEVRFNSRR